MQKTLGGDRLGSGKRQKIDMHHYERSTHDMGYIWRSTMAAGTLVPFMKLVALPGDTFDINLDADIKTHPTIGPLFGSYKVQLDVFQCPIRLYQGQLHNNKLGIGMKMATVKLPQMGLVAFGRTDEPADIDNYQINPSMIFSYLGIRGIGWVDASESAAQTRDFNAVPFLAYWDIYKNYYANKQEEIGAVIHQEFVALVQTVDDVTVNNGADTIPNPPGSPGTAVTIGSALPININYTGAVPLPEQIVVYTNKGNFTLDELVDVWTNDGVATTLWGIYNQSKGVLSISEWQYLAADNTPMQAPKVATFPLENIDKMRENILADVASTSPFNLNAQNLTPYSWALEHDTVAPYTWTAYNRTQEGLAIKTYQSDLFNNWLSTEWIDGPGGINEITAVDTSTGSFKIDSLILARKVYDMLNRIAVSGGTYDDWLDVQYTHERFTRCESPIYEGGLSKELVFQEVVSNTEAETAENGVQPLGTLAGKGVMGKKHKGGQLVIKVDEPSYIIGIISLTPRIDYSQGNEWDTNLDNMDDFHKPALDEIGFQELIQEQMAHWTTKHVPGTGWVTQSAGKQPAWINYMTNVNVVRGNFAIGEVGEMFMTLNRRYEFQKTGTVAEIKDLTTYIDPVKYNHIFAETSIDAQNFWAQIAVDITARRKMSAKVMPNL